MELPKWNGCIDYIDKINLYGILNNQDILDTYNVGENYYRHWKHKVNRTDKNLITHRIHLLVREG